MTGQLTTPSPSGGYASAYGYMFDVKSKSSEALRVLKFTLFYTNSQCNFDLWSRIGESSSVSNDPAAWTLISQGQLMQAGSNKGILSGKDFPPQSIPSGQTRAFYISLYGCSSTWPMKVNGGSNPGGVAVENDDIALIEGIKKNQVSAAGTFGSNSYSKFFFVWAISNLLL